MKITEKDIGRTVRFNEDAETRGQCLGVIKRVYHKGGIEVDLKDGKALLNFNPSELQFTERRRRKETQHEP